MAPSASRLAQVLSGSAPGLTLQPDGHDGWRIVSRTQEPMRLLGGAIIALGVLPAVAMVSAVGDGAWLMGALLASAAVSVEALGWATWAGYEPDTHELRVTAAGVDYRWCSGGEVEAAETIDDDDVTAVDIVEQLDGDYSVVVRAPDATVRLALKSAADAAAVRGCLMTTLPSMAASTADDDWPAQRQTA